VVWLAAPIRRLFAPAASSRNRMSMRDAATPQSIPLFLNL
jgi:hypothetical protein